MFTKQKHKRPRNREMDKNKQIHGTMKQKLQETSNTYKLKKKSEKRK